MTTAEPPETCLPNYSYTFQRDVLRGKVAFITGGGTGICFTIAEVFMRHQCNVVIASRRLEKLRAAAQTLERETGMRCLAVQMDVRKPDAILKAVDEALSAFGKIDILVNGAAGNFLCPVDSMSFNAFRTVMDIDTNGTFNVTKAVYDKWLKAHGGVIINITATLQVRGQALQTHAGSAKAAIEAMTRHMAVEMGPRNIRVMCVAPGPITNTEGFRKLGGGSLPGDAEVFQDIPIGRAGERVEIADVCLFLCTPAAALLTGTTVIADGGAWLTSMNGMKRYASLMAAAQASKSKL